jgi:hypothetical protein
MKLSAHALRSLQELDEAGRKAVEQIVQSHVRACRLNGFQPENLERVYQEAIEIIRLEGPPKNESLGHNKYEPTRRYEQYRSPRALWYSASLLLPDSSHRPERHWLLFSFGWS